MANLSKIIYINEEDYSTLLSDGSITKAGTTYTYDNTALYIIKNISAPEYAETAGYATSAGTSARAIRDESGNIIEDTYVKNPIIATITTEANNTYSVNPSIATIKNYIDGGREVILRGGDGYNDDIYYTYEGRYQDDLIFTTSALHGIRVIILGYGHETISSIYKYIPEAETSASNIQMDGIASASVGGITRKYAKADHRHPSDTSKQDTLVSGTNIKTINNQSLLGSGNLTASDIGALPSTTTIPTVPTNVSAFTNDAGYLTSHLDISGKADKSEMSVSTGSDNTTITLKSGTFATVINQHNVVIGKLLNGNFYSGVYVSQLRDWHFSNTAETGNSKKLYVDVVNKLLYKYEGSYVSVTGDFVTIDMYTNDMLDLYENKADIIQVVTVSTTGAVTQAMDANKFYDFTGSPTSLTLTLNSSSVGLSIYAGKFTAGTGFSNLSVPSSVKLADNAPVVEAGGTYEFSIMNNLMLIIKEVAT